jgi:hypothetical protein
MTNYATEIIKIEAGLNYAPTFISTDKRRSSIQPTSLGYYQIGELQQYGNAKGPIFKIEFADLTSITAQYVKIWGLDNDDTNAPIYPVTYLQTWRPVVDIYLKKFIFCQSDGTPVEESSTSYTILAYKRKVIPTVL